MSARPSTRKRSIVGSAPRDSLRRPRRRHGPAAAVGDWDRGKDRAKARAKARPLGSAWSGGAAGLRVCGGALSRRIGRRSWRHRRCGVRALRRCAGGRRRPLLQERLSGAADASAAGVQCKHERQPCRDAGSSGHARVALDCSRWQAAAADAGARGSTSFGTKAVVADHARKVPEDAHLRSGISSDGPSRWSLDEFPRIRSFNPPVPSPIVPR